MKVLKESEAKAQLKNLDGWKIRGKTLSKEYGFEEFNDGLAFVVKIAKVAERQDHHPDVLLSYGKVVLNVTTHSAGELTDKDFRLAAAIDNVSR